MQVVFIEEKSHEEKDAETGEKIVKVTREEVPFEVHPHERLNSVAVRFARFRGVPRPPPNVVATLADAIDGRVLLPSMTVKQAARLVFQLGAFKADRMYN